MLFSQYFGALDMLVRPLIYPKYERMTKEFIGPCSIPQITVIILPSAPYVLTQPRVAQRRRGVTSPADL